MVVAMISSSRERELRPRIAAGFSWPKARLAAAGIEPLAHGDPIERLRADIDSGRTGEKVSASDPAAAPLGTDDEAGHAAQA
jgi:hypothetical protein